MTAMTESQRLAALDDMLLPGAEHVIAEAKVSGKTPLETAAAVLNAHRAHMIAAGHAEYAEKWMPPGARRAAPTTIEGWKAEYDASADLQAEYGSSDEYANYQAAVRDGRVRIFKPGAGGIIRGGSVSMVKDD